MTVEKYGPGPHRRTPWAVRRLQLERVADSNVQSLAEVLGQHHSPTSEHRSAHLIIERPVERVGGAGGKPVEHHPRPTDLGKPGCALGDSSYPRNRGHLVGEILRQRVHGIAVGGIGTHPTSTPATGAKMARAERIMSAFVPVITTVVTTAMSTVITVAHTRRGARSIVAAASGTNRSENPGRRGCGLDHDRGQREAERDLSAE